MIAFLIGRGSGDDVDGWVASSAGQTESDEAVAADRSHYSPLADRLSDPISVRVIARIEVGIHAVRAVSPDARYALVAGEEDLCVLSLRGDSKSCVPWVGRSLSRLGAWSPDGRYVAFTEDYWTYLHDSDIWVIDTVTGDLANLTNDDFEGDLDIDNHPVDYGPFWGSDSASLFFYRAERNGDDVSVRLVRTAPSGGEAVDVLHEFQGTFPDQVPPVFMDDQILAYHVSNPREQGGTWNLDLLAGTDSRMPLPDVGERPSPQWISQIELDKSNVALVTYLDRLGQIGQVRDAVFEIVDLSSREAASILAIEDLRERYVGPYGVALSPDGSVAVITWRDLSVEDLVAHEVSLVPLDGSLPVAIGDLKEVAIPGSDPALKAPGLYGQIVWSDDNVIVLRSLEGLVVVQLEFAD